MYACTSCALVHPREEETKHASSTVDGNRTVEKKVRGFVASRGQEYLGRSYRGVPAGLPLATTIPRRSHDRRRGHTSERAGPRRAGPRPVRPPLDARWGPRWLAGLDSGLVDLGNHQTGELTFRIIGRLPGWLPRDATIVFAIVRPPWPPRSSPGLSDSRRFPPPSLPRDAAKPRTLKRYRSIRLLTRL
eukprot:gene25650-11313_t